MEHHAYESEQNTNAQAHETAVLVDEMIGNIASVLRRSTE